MKEFEDYWAFTGLDELVYYHPDPEGGSCIEVSGINRKEERQVGWKAALEWVLKTSKELEETDAPIDMGDVIEMELSDE